MFVSAVFVPSAPLLAPELAGPGATDTVPVREAAVSAARSLAGKAERWIAIGAGDGDVDRTTRFVSDGSFARFGVDVAVSLNKPNGTRAAAGVVPADGFTGPARLPLSMLIAGWLRGQASEAVSVTPLVISPSASATECARVGAEIAEIVDADPDPIGVLVVADGATALSSKAPGGGRRAEAVDVQTRIDSAIERADVVALAGLDAAECAASGVDGRPAWQVAAAAIGERAVTVQLDFVGAPFGVGYVVAQWTSAQWTSAQRVATP